MEKRVAQRHARAQTLEQRRNGGGLHEKMVHDLEPTLGSGR